MCCSTWDEGAEWRRHEAHTAKLLQDVFSTIQRSEVMVTMGKTFKKVFDQLPDAVNRTEMGDAAREMLKGRIGCIKISVESSERELREQLRYIY